MKYIFDKPVTEFDTFALSFAEMTKEQINFCYDNLPNLEVLSGSTYTTGFIVDEDGWFTNHKEMPLGDLIKFEEVFINE